MPRSNEDEAWRAIVDNYGDRVELGPDEAPVAEAAPDHLSEQLSEQPSVPAELAATHEDERFRPPPPPPLPYVPRDRMVAWVGLFGSPAVLLTALVLGIEMPSLVGYLLVCGFIGGFLYLVVQMPRGPHDPFDDGARI